MVLTDQELEERMMAEAQAAIRELLAQKKPADEITLTEIEVLVRQAGQRMMGQMTALLVADSSDRQQVPGPVCPGCGQEMAYKGHKGKHLTADTGEAELSRAHYYCATCEAGFFPPG
jgi:hypothetical protein